MKLQTNIKLSRSTILKFSGDCGNIRFTEYH